MTNIESTTWFDLLPTEIIFLIFEYLSNDDIIYTFIHFSQRLNNLLLQNQRYLTSLVLPTTNLNIWKKTLLVVGSQIKYLTIENDELTIPLTYFPNLKSIVESNGFKNVHSLKINTDKSFCYESFYDSTKNQNSILDKVFNKKNSLETFQYTILSGLYKPINTKNFSTNFNLHSLILRLGRFNDIFTLIEYTPNLKYLTLVRLSLFITRTVYVGPVGPTCK